MVGVAIPPPPAPPHPCQLDAWVRTVLASAAGLHLGAHPLSGTQDVQTCESADQAPSTGGGSRQHAGLDYLKVMPSCNCPSGREPMTVVPKVCYASVSL